MKLAVIDRITNKVVNVIIADKIPTIKGKLCIASDIANIDDDYDGIDFIKPIATAPALDIKQEALFALDKTDMVALRCFKKGSVFPIEWQNYVATLRDVVSGVLLTMPIKPNYPKGS